MKFEEHEEIINNLNLNDPLIERLKKYIDKDGNIVEIVRNGKSPEELLLELS